ncbi:MAG: MarR family transcriptional regulator [Ilumatobacteraceae bacterium]
MPTDPSLQFDPIAEARRHWAEHGWEAAAPGMAALTSIMRVQQILLQRVESVLRPLGLTFARYELLTLLSFSRTGSLPLGKIGVRLQVHAASVTNAVDRLEREGLVERVPHDNDGRVTLAQLTDKGRALATEATALLNEQVFEQLGISESDTKALYDLLAQVRRSAGDYA